MTVRWNAKPTLRRPALVAAFSGWNDAADAASDGVRWLARSVECAGVRDARHGGVPRLPSGAAHRRARRRRHPRDPVARARVLRRFDARRRPRSRAAARRRAQPALADVLRRRDLGRPGDRLRDGRDPRRAARRRAALATDALHRLGDRRGPRRAPRHGAVALRGTDRASSACSTTPHDGVGLRVGVDLGAGAALRRDRAEPEGDARAAHAARRSLLDVGLRAHRSRDRGRGVGAIRRRGRRRRRRRELVRGAPRAPLRRSSAAPSLDEDDDDEDERRRPTKTGSTRTTFRRASRSPKTSSATYASRATSSPSPTVASRRGRGRGRPRDGSTARATRCRPARRCRGTSMA